MLEGVTKVKIYGEKYESQIDVQRVDGFSAHAGQTFLTEYAMRVKGCAKDIFQVHGEARGAEPLQEILNEKGMDNLHFPERGSAFEL